MSDHVALISLRFGNIPVVTKLFLQICPAAEMRPLLRAICSSSFHHLALLITATRAKESAYALVSLVRLRWGVCARTVCLRTGCWPMSEQTSSHCIASDWRRGCGASEVSPLRQLQAQFPTDGLAMRSSRSRLQIVARSSRLHLKPGASNAELTFDEHSRTTLHRNIKNDDLHFSS